jgi:hypothetical protein
MFKMDPISLPQQRGYDLQYVDSKYWGQAKGHLKITTREVSVHFLSSFCFCIGFAHLPDRLAAFVLGIVYGFWSPFLLLLSKVHSPWTQPIGFSTFCSCNVLEVWTCS